MNICIGLFMNVFFSLFKKTTSCNPGVYGTGIAFFIHPICSFTTEIPGLKSDPKQELKEIKNEHWRSSHNPFFVYF